MPAPPIPADPPAPVVPATLAPPCPAAPVPPDAPAIPVPALPPDPALPVVPPALAPPLPAPAPDAPPAPAIPPAPAPASDGDSLPPHPIKASNTAASAALGRETLAVTATPVITDLCGKRQSPSSILQRRPAVNGSIAAAIEGKFGNAQFSDRTVASELFINPLMAIYFAFDLSAVARQSLYLHLLEDIETIFDVGTRIRAFRRSVQTRPRVPIPH